MRRYDRRPQGKQVPLPSRPLQLCDELGNCEVEGQVRLEIVWFPVQVTFRNQASTRTSTAAVQHLREYCSRQRAGLGDTFFIIDSTPCGWSILFSSPATAIRPGRIATWSEPCRAWSRLMERGSGIRHRLAEETEGCGACPVLGPTAPRRGREYGPWTAAAGQPSRRDRCRPGPTVCTAGRDQCEPAGVGQPSAGKSCKDCRTSSRTSMCSAVALDRGPAKSFRSGIAGIQHDPRLYFNFQAE